MFPSKRSGEVQTFVYLPVKEEQIKASYERTGI
jgi:hypothetical protein